MALRVGMIGKNSLLALAVMALLSACGDGQEKKATTQVAVKVNDSEISVHQVNGVLSKLQGVRPEMVPKVRQEVVDKLVEQQLAYDQAVAGKLDRSPDVMMAVEAAKREIVARAYLDQIVAALPKPDEAEVSRYYNEHPDLFARRKLYNLQELALAPSPAVAQEVRQLLVGGASLDQVVAGLQERKIPFRPAQGVKPAEQVPLDVLPQLAAMKDGQLQLIETPQSLMLVRLVGSHDAPVDLASASPRIQQFLLKQRGQQAAEAEIKRLKEAARIQFVGEFANLQSAAPAADASKPGAAAAPQAAPEANIEKGVAGLK